MSMPHKNLVIDRNGPTFVEKYPQTPKVLAEETQKQEKIEQKEVKQKQLEQELEEKKEKKEKEEKEEKTELVSSNKPGDKLAYNNIIGTKTGAILGLFPVNYQVETTVGAQTGQIININQPFWVNLLGFLIR